MRANRTAGKSGRQKVNQEVQILLHGLQGNCLLLLPGPSFFLPLGMIRQHTNFFKTRFHGLGRFYAELIEDPDAETPSLSDSDSLALADSALGSSARPPVIVSVDCIAIPPYGGFSFQILKLRAVRVVTSQVIHQRNLMIMLSRPHETAHLPNPNIVTLRFE